MKIMWVNENPYCRIFYAMIGKYDWQSMQQKLTTITNRTGPTNAHIKPPDEEIQQADLLPQPPDCRPDDIAAMITGIPEKIISN